MAMPTVKIDYLPRHVKDKEPYVATVVGDGFEYHAQAPSPNEALLLVAAHWHSRAGVTPS